MPRGVWPRFGAAWITAVNRMRNDLCSVCTCKFFLAAVAGVDTMLPMQASVVLPRPPVQQQQQPATTASARLAALETRLASLVPHVSVAEQGAQALSDRVARLEAELDAVRDRMAGTLRVLAERVAHLEAALRAVRGSRSSNNSDEEEEEEKEDADGFIPLLV